MKNTIITRVFNSDSGYKIARLIRLSIKSQNIHDVTKGDATRAYIIYT